MATPLKLISTDFDGTFFAEFELPPVPARLVDLIAGLQADGCKWVINTGRDMSSLMESLARARVAIQPDYLVLVEREIYIHDGVRYVPHKPWNAACSSDHESLFALVRPDVPRLMEWVSSRFIATVYEDAYSPFCLIAGNNGDANIIHDYLEEYAARIPGLTVVRNDVYARFSHVAYNKGTALAELTAIVGAEPNEVFAVGDHLNDLPMLRLSHACWLAAPGNAVPQVRKSVLSQGGFVSPSNCGSGVAEALEHWLYVLQREK